LILHVTFSGELTFEIFFVFVLGKVLSEACLALTSDHLLLAPLEAAQRLLCSGAGVGGKIKWKTVALAIQTAARLGSGNRETSQAKVPLVLCTFSHPTL